MKLLSLRGEVPARAARKQDRLGRGRGARILLFQPLDEESKLPCAFDYELHSPATPAKETGIVLMRCIIAKALYGKQNIGFSGPPTECSTAGLPAGSS